jgi:ElaB/YqjD/DUF883 family membrane-anchored ribosome-binding protein
MEGFMAMSRKRKTVQNGRKTQLAAAQARVKSLRSDLGTLQDDVKKLVNDAGAAASNGMQGAVTGALKTAQDAVERVEDWGAENIGEARDAVRSQPLAALALSMGAGAIIGALLLR